MWTTIIYTVYHTYIRENWKEEIKPTFCWQQYCYDHTDFLCVGTVCCALSIVIIISKITTFVFIAEGCRCWQENSGFCCDKGRHYLPASFQKKIDAVIVLLGCFYVFNVSYTQCKAILTFLDQALLESGLGQTLVNVSSLF